jgi:hypothetical protein
MAYSRLKTKWQLTIFFEAIVVLLAFYTLGSLWEYADTLNATNGWMLKVGFTACEVAVGVWVWFHVWRRFVGTRLIALGLATATGIFLVVHSSAISKYVAAKKEAGASTSTLADGLAKITGSASEGVVTGAGKVADGQRQKGAPNTARATVKEGTNAAAKIGVENGKVLAETSLKLEEQAKASTFLSADYLNGKMQAVVFVWLLVGIAITALAFEAFKAEEDDDDDGIPNFADADSTHYNADRAAKWWGSRGQLAPHQLAARSLPAQPAPPPAPTIRPNIQPGFASGVPAPPAGRIGKLMRRLRGQSASPNSPANH